SAASAQTTALDMGLGFVRLVAGGSALLLGAAYLFQNMLPASLKPALNFLNAIPIPAEILKTLYTYFGLGAGAALLVSGFSKRRYSPWLVVAGAAMILGSSFIHPLIPSFLHVDDTLYTYTALGLMAGGLAVAG